MRKLKLQIQLSIDGFCGRQNGELDWMTWDWDQELKDFLTANLFDSVDTIIMGKNLAEGFIPYWEGVKANPKDPQHSAGIKFTDTPKVVFSNTLKESKWENAVVANGDLSEEVNNLKKQDGGDIIVYGGADFVSSLVKENLIDEYYLFINPTAIGNGKSIFHKVEDKLSLNLQSSRQYKCGIVVNTYTK